MHVSHGRVTGKPSEQRTATFTGADYSAAAAG
jgi:hypothetical protein